VTPAEARFGEPVTIAGYGYPARSELRVELVRGSVLLGTTRADASGTFRIVVTVPAGTTPGLHTIRVRTRFGSTRAETSALIQPRPPDTVESVGDVGGSLLRVFG
jgi:hypothetical protein